MHIKSLKAGMEKRKPKGEFLVETAYTLVCAFGMGTVFHIVRLRPIVSAGGICGGLGAVLG
jgi:hypothetical protein